MMSESFRASDGNEITSVMTEGASLKLPMMGGWLTLDSLKLKCMALSI